MSLKYTSVIYFQPRSRMCMNQNRLFKFTILLTYSLFEVYHWSSQRYWISRLNRCDESEKRNRAEMTNDNVYRYFSYYNVVNINDNGHIRPWFLALTFSITLLWLGRELSGSKTKRQFRKIAIKSEYYPFNRHTNMITVMFYLQKL